jgi:uncharacterized protein YrrD
MKKSQEIIGLPVFSIIDGRKIGQVKDLVINPDEGKLDFVLVSNGSWYTGARVLPFKAVMGIGEHAITTESENQLTNISETAYASLLEKNIEIKGTRLLTNKGNFIGEISEYEIEEDTGEITRLHYKCANDESKVEIAEADRVLTFGVDVVVVKQNTNDTGENITTLIANHDDNETQTSGADFFKRKQRTFLIGKKVFQDIQNAAGENLITKGTVVTEDILNLAEYNGKFIELSQYAK